MTAEQIRVQLIRYPHNEEKFSCLMLQEIAAQLADWNEMQKKAIELSTKLAERSLAMMEKADKALGES